VKNNLEPGLEPDSDRVASAGIARFEYYRYMTSWIQSWGIYYWSNRKRRL
jgi:hypothetical protein